MKKRDALLTLLALWLPLVLSVGSLSGAPDLDGTEHSPPSANEGAITAASRDQLTALPPAFFPHDAHVGDMGIDCVTCHHETNAAPLSLPHPDYFEDFWIDCKICHNESAVAASAPKACSECHHSQNGNIADQTLSTKVVIHKSCWSCHTVTTGVGASSTCRFCHRDGD